jgi:uncharacterized protein with ParB-like and HNH nuclease domain
MGKVFSSGGDIHYVLPHFQREYAWDKPEWQMLLKDIFAIYEIFDDEQPPEHFMGALVVINDGMQAGTVPVFRLVDGQQRLTTISLLLCALQAVVVEDENLQGLHKKIGKMLVNADEDGMLYYKLLPTLKYGDRVSYCALIDGKPTPAGIESKVPMAYAFLLKELTTQLRGNGYEPNRLFNVLMTSLQVVYINLDQRERPYEIFESLNYKGKSLTQADLVRNYIAMKLPQKRQEAAFIDLWSPIEEMLLEKRSVGRSRFGELTGFLRHYFAMLSGVLINEDHVYSRFRDRGELMTADEFEMELRRLKRFARYYDRLLRPEKEPDSAVRERLVRLNILEISTGYPFLMSLYDRHENGAISREDFVVGMGVIETYMVRRFLNRDSTNFLNKMFPTLVKEVTDEDFVNNLTSALGTKREPSDVRLRRSAETVNVYRRDVYTRQKLNLIFQTINRRLSEGSGAFTMLDADPTIEHIMPQTLSEAWKQALGESWAQDHDLLLHTLGNLTPVTQAWNSHLSNSIYTTKRAKLAQHGLRLNADYFAEGVAPDVWNGDAIRARAQWLMELVATNWPQMGETPSGFEEQPKTLTIMGENFPVNSWRDVLRQTADVVLTLLGDSFEEKVVAAMPTYFQREPHKSASYQLANGWWMLVNLSVEWVKKACDMLLEAAEIPEDEFDVVLW